MDNIIAIDDYIIGYVADVKKYIRKNVLDLMDRDGDFLDELKEWIEVFEKVAPFNNGLIKVYPNDMGDYVVKILDV